MGSGIPARNLSISDYLDVIWAYQFENLGAFSSPGDYRRIMKAVFGYSEETVEEVQADLEAQREGGKPSGNKRPTQAGVAKPKTAQLDALAAIMAQAKEAQASEPPPPDV